MIKIHGLELSQKKYKNSDISIYTGFTENNDEKTECEIAVINKSNINTDILIELKSDLEKILSLKSEGICKIFRIAEQENEIIIAYEKCTGVTIDDFFDNKNIDLKIFLLIAIEISETLGLLHKKEIIFKDINPQNIKIEVKSNRPHVKLINFGITSFINHSNNFLFDKGSTKKILPYISPEQTGRIKRIIDYRTDFYSLGMIFYMILTGSAPFISENPMELIHYHLAKKAVPPCEINKGIPEPISDIIMKLISKNAEDRYQSSYGLKSDLVKCLKQLENYGEIIEFELFKDDISDRFSIPEKLYGREKETEKLLESLKRVCKGGVEIMLATGHSGIGKSALIHEINKPVVNRNGYFVSGKFEKLKNSVPYSAIIHAFKELIKQVLTEDEEKINRFRNNLQRSLDPNGQIIADMIPEIELIIGRQLPVSELAPPESQNRFNIVFHKFLSVFAKAEHPLIIFLDDLQWADHASINLIKSLVTDPEREYFYLIGAYRNNEVDTFHILTAAMDQINRSGIHVNSISLGALEPNDINMILKDTLKISNGGISSLSELIYKKTSGNPLYIKQFLISLYREDLITYDQNSGWQWDIDHIKNMLPTEDMIELMTERITKLPENTQEVLKIASCIGNSFSLKTLSIAYGKSTEDTYSELSSSVQDCLILRFEELYMFAHDRIRESCYNLIPETHRKKIHLSIGEKLLKKFKKNDIDIMVSDIVNQFYYGRDLITDHQTRREAARLNLKAGRKAKSSAAFQAALKCFKAGMEMLNEESWCKDYDLTFNIHIEIAETEYINTNFDEAEKLFDITLFNSKTNIDKAKVYSTKATLYTNINKIEEAALCCIKGLNLFGYNISCSPTKFSIIKELLKTKMKLRTIRIDDPIDLPEIKTPELLWALNLFMNLTAPAYFMSKELFTLTVLKMLNISIEKGISPVSGYAFAAGGIVLGAGAGDYRSAHQLGRLALRLSETTNNRLLKGRINFLFGNLINHWINHADSDKDYLLKGFRFGLESGDLVYAGYNINMYILTLICTGKPLAGIYRELKKYFNLFRRTKNPAHIHVCRSNTDYILKLTGLPLENDAVLGKDLFNRDSLFIPDEKKEIWLNTDLFIHYNHNTKISYIMGDHSRAYDLHIEAEKHIDGSLGLLDSAEFHFYGALTMTALCAEASGHQKKIYLKKISRNCKILKKWAENCNANFHHKYILIKAELAKIFRKNEEAVKLYNESINSALENNYIQNAAIGSELAGKFYMDIGMEKIAKNYFIEAWIYYHKWDAVTKAKALEKKYWELFLHSPAAKVNSYSAAALNLKRSAGYGTEILDLAAIIKASQALSGEIILSKLLKKILTIVIENAGAEKGCLILERYGNLFIEAEGNLNSAKIRVFESKLIESDMQIPLAVINYVKRTHENVVLGNASDEGLFTSDPYIKFNKPKSIICVPLMGHEKFIGLLYLENNLTINAFTEERLRILSVLGSQAAISLENAKLYEDMRRLNFDLEEEISFRVKIEEALETEKEGLAIVNKLMQIGLNKSTLEEKLQTALENIISIPWLSITPKGAIFTVREGSDLLELKAYINFDSEHVKTCSKIPFGKCICGKAAQSSKIIYMGCINSDHDILLKGMTPHGHYAVPIVQEDKILGVLILYLKEQHKRDTRKEEFLYTVANTLAGIIKHKIEEDEFEKLQAQFIRSQKLESIGRLAGGVAHDFNNMLSVIIGLSELSMMELDDSDPVKENIKSIYKAGEKAANLTRQLLAFSRRQFLEMKVLNLNKVISNMALLLNSIIGDDISLIFNPCNKLKNIKADPSQIEQIIMNLAVNAKDAMPKGGQLIIETNNIIFDENYASTHDGIQTGEYVLISVTDTGAGMEKDVMENIFEPFYTTKEAGKGTGLGLSTVYGIVKQHKGYIWVYSETDKGTTFKIYFPITSGSLHSTAKPAPAEIADGSETILIVEDEKAIRKMIINTLTPLGYKILEASSGEEAIKISDQFNGKIDLLITDVVMHGINGFELAEHLKKIRKGLKVLLMSGYTDRMLKESSIIKAERENNSTAFIQKPFTLARFAGKVRDIIENKKTP